MKLLSKYVNQNSLKQYYNSYVLPVFDFGRVVWGNTTTANLTRLVRLQKRAARMILKADFMTPSEQLFKELYKELNWLPFPKRVQFFYTDRSKAVLLLWFLTVLAVCVYTLVHLLC